MGEIISDVEITKRYGGDNNTAPYTIGLTKNNNYNIDASIKRYYGGLINHSDNPNCVLNKMTYDDFSKTYGNVDSVDLEKFNELGDEFFKYYPNKSNVDNTKKISSNKKKQIIIIIIALKNIKYGDELFINYNDGNKNKLRTRALLA